MKAHDAVRFLEDNDARLRQTMVRKAPVGPYDGEDMYHDAIVSFLERLETIDGSNPAGYIYRCAHNRMVDINRQFFRHPLLPLPEYGVFVPPFESDCITGITLEAALELVGDLPREQRDCVVLRLLGFCDREVSQMTGQPLGTVKTRFLRARIKVYNRMQGLA